MTNVAWHRPGFAAEWLTQVGVHTWPVRVLWKARRDVPSTREWRM